MVCKLKEPITEQWHHHHRALLHVMSAGQWTVNQGLHLKKTPQHMQTLRHDRYKYLHAHHRKWVTEAGRCVCHSEIMWHLRMILCDSCDCCVTLCYFYQQIPSGCSGLSRWSPRPVSSERSADLQTGVCETLRRCPHVLCVSCIRITWWTDVLLWKWESGELFTDSLL